MEVMEVTVGRKAVVKAAVVTAAVVGKVEVMGKEGSSGWGWR